MLSLATTAQMSPLLCVAAGEVRRTASTDNQRRRTDGAADPGVISFNAPLALETNPKPAGTLPESDISTLKDVAYLLSNACVFEASGDIAKLRKSSPR